MTVFTHPGSIIITCYPFLSEYLSNEVSALGFEVVESSTTSVTVNGNLNDCIRLNFNLRTASRVLYSLHSFECHSMQEMYDGIAGIEWERYLDTMGYLSVTSSSNHPEVKNTMFLNMRVKDAIADRFMRLYNKRPDSGSAKHGFSAHVLWKNEQALVSIDTSGASLTKHGYRLHPFKAPLQESLAAAMIMATGWDQQAAFINPMTGSGTLAIEAALIASCRPPGLFRDDYAFMHVKGFERGVLEAVRTEALGNVKANIVSTIVATDADHEAIEAARKNAEVAGVQDMIQFEQCDFMETTLPEGPGILMLNPPYGTRLGEVDELGALYKRIGEFFKKRCSGKTAFMLTAERELAAQVGLRASRKIPFLNADLECRLLKYEMYSGTRKMKNPDGNSSGS